jgi:hypothetical protein
MKIDVFVLEEKEYSDESNKFGESFSYYKFSDVMSEGELIYYVMNNHLNWIKFNGVIKDSAGFERFRITTKTIEIF